MDFAEMVKDLPDETKAALLEAHTAAVEQERNRGISESRKKGEEVKKHITEVNRIKDSLKRNLDLDFSSDVDIDDLLGEKVKTFKASTVNTNDYVPKAEFAKIQKQMGEIITREEIAQAKLRNVSMTEALNQVMGETIHAKDFVIMNLIASGSVRQLDDGAVVYMDGGEELDLKAGIERFKKSRPDVVKNISNPGSGSSSARNRSSASEMTLTDFNKLPPVDMAKFMSSGGKVTD